MKTKSSIVFSWYFINREENLNKNLSLVPDPTDESKQL